MIDICRLLFLPPFFPASGPPAFMRSWVHRMSVKDRLGISALALILLLLPVLFLLPPDGAERAEWAQFIGRFHLLILTFLSHSSCWCLCWNVREKATAFPNCGPQLISYWRWRPSAPL